MEQRIGVVDGTYVDVRDRPPERPAPLKPPPEPTIVAGPRFELSGGKLSGIATRPQPREVDEQRRLHSELRTQVLEAVERTARLENRHPELVRSIKQYSTVLARETEHLDVVGAFSSGGALLSFYAAYREQNILRTMSEPLEPQTAALLQNVARMHGAFIMGFDEGRDLVERADQFLVDTKVLADLAGPGPELLALFTDNKDLVDERTRRANQPLRDYVTEYGWGTSRVGYSAYTLVRNGVFSLVKFSFGSEVSPLALVGAANTISWMMGDANGDFLRASLPALQQHAGQMVSFFAHSPEMRAYVEWATHMLQEDQKLQDALENAARSIG